MPAAAATTAAHSTLRTLHQPSLRRCRCRYFETEAWQGLPPPWWFGGGTDITPSYVYDEDMKHFHGTYKRVCDEHDPAYYQKFRQWCAWRTSWR